MNEVDIRVSIIVPVYNGELYVSECLDSLIRQTLQPIEIIVIDDCSTDKTPDILADYSKRDKRIRVFRNETNLRQGLSRSRALLLARGDYVGFVDADDWVEESFFEKLFQAASYGHASIAKAAALTVHSDGSVEKFANINTAIIEGLKHGEPLGMHFTYEFWTAIYLRSDLIANGVTFPDIRNGEDLVFLMQATHFLSKIVVVPGVYYYYRQHENSTESIKNEAYFDSIILAGYKMLDFISTHYHSHRDRDLLAAYVIQFLSSRIAVLDNRPDLAEYASKYKEGCMKIVIKSDISELNLSNKITAGYHNLKTVKSIYSSASYRIGNIILYPFIFLSRKFSAISQYISRG
jgi:glycosyltransferase involved in cell wall biosynthesis